MGNCNKCPHASEDHTMIGELMGLQKWKCTICGHVSIGEMRSND